MFTRVDWCLQLIPIRIQSQEQWQHQVIQTAALVEHGKDYINSKKNVDDSRMTEGDIGEL